MSDETKRAEVTDEHRQTALDALYWHRRGLSSQEKIEWVKTGVRPLKNLKLQELEEAAQLIADAEARGVRRGRAKALEGAEQAIRDAWPNAIVPGREEFIARIRALAAKETT